MADVYPYSELVRRLALQSLSPAQNLRKAAKEEAAARLRQLMEQQINLPGRAPGGTGPTGLNANDASGYANLLNEQKEAVDLQGLLKGRMPQAAQGMYPGSTGSRLAPMGASSAFPVMNEQAAQTGGYDPSRADWEGIRGQSIAVKKAQLQEELMKAQEAQRMIAEQQGNPELAAAKRAATVQDFAQRRGVQAWPVQSGEPTPVSGIRGMGPIGDITAVAGSPRDPRHIFTTGAGRTEMAREAGTYQDPSFPGIIAGREALGETNTKVLAAEAAAQAKLIAELLRGQSSENVAGIQGQTARDVQTSKGLTALTSKFGGQVVAPDTLTGRIQQVLGGSLEDKPLLQDALRRNGVDPDALMRGQPAIGAPQSGGVTPEAVSQALRARGLPSDPESVRKAMSSQTAMRQLFPQ